MNKDTYDLKDILSLSTGYKVLIFTVLCIKVLAMGAYLAYLIHVAPHIKAYNDRMGNALV